MTSTSSVFVLVTLALLLISEGGVTAADDQVDKPVRREDLLRRNRVRGRRIRLQRNLQPLASFSFDVAVRDNVSGATRLRGAGSDMTQSLSTEQDNEAVPIEKEDGVTDQPIP